MKIIAITQARVGSSRLPAKVLQKIEGKPMLMIHLERIKRSALVMQVIVATTQEPDADQIVAIADECGLSSFKGSTSDVLDRYYQAARSLAPDYVVRLTSDCPLLDPLLIDQITAAAIENGMDYTSNTLKPFFPDGQDVEVFRFSALERAWKEASLKSEREHVSSYIWKNSSFFGNAPFSSANYANAVDYSSIRMTVDEPRDFDTVKMLIQHVGADRGWEEYAKYYEEHASDMPNNTIIRNEGYSKSLTKDK